MTEILEPASGEIAEPSPKIADALRVGAARGAQTAREVWTLLGRGTSITAYNGAYYLAYGATFGAMFVGHLIPRASAFSRGLHEGTENAVSAFHTWEEPTSAPEQRVTEAEAIATERPVIETPGKKPVPAT